MGVVSCWFRYIVFLLKIIIGVECTFPMSHFYVVTFSNVLRLDDFNVIAVVNFMD